ncbi:hypothetical protein T07_12707 [Trichinella nelsoni]|uniref:Uncharacterized protein n=1 Tax=Trichinella nelsoni TaxID=6336 RepID=A0A0V0SIY0_9BILA|nr:hypothetical protein T07_12707 [Trichinella nelsoni]
MLLPSTTTRGLWRLIPFHMSFHHPIGSYTASAALDTCKSIPPMRGESPPLQWRQHLLQATCRLNSISA